MKIIAQTVLIRPFSIFVLFETYLKEKENGIDGKEFQVSSVSLALVLTLKIDF